MKERKGKERRKINFFKKERKQGKKKERKKEKKSLFR